MFYRTEPNAGNKKLYFESYSRSRLPYRTVREIRALYPDGDFVIVGEIGSAARPPTGGDALITDDGRRIPIMARGSYKKPFEWIGGYIAVKNGAYIAAIGSVLPAFLRRRKL
jgi:phospholipase/carboxylesterase